MKHIGLIISHKTPKDTIKAIIKADKAGVETVWSISGGMAPDLLTYYAAAAIQTKQIRFGTSIIPILPRHPVILATQALVLENLAPGRLRLGVGPSHKYPMEQMFGLSFEQPQAKLKEYVHILRQALWDGKVDFSGKFYNVKNILLPDHINPPKTPILISALREKAFEIAGEIAEGAISWMCPVDYLIAAAKPALQAGSKKAKRPAPPLIAHVPVAFSNDFDKVLTVSQQQLGRYGKMPFYANMFSDAGYPVEQNGVLSKRLLENLVVYGTAQKIRERLEAIFRLGIDEILVSQVIINDPEKEEKALIDLISS